MLKNDEHALDFALHLYRLLRSALSRACHSCTSVRLMLSFPSLVFIPRVSVAIFPRFAQKTMLFAKSHRAGYMTRTRNSTKSARPPSCVKFCALTPKILSTVASRYHNCCKYDITSLWNYGHPFAIILILNIYISFPEVQSHIRHQLTILLTLSVCYINFHLLRTNVRWQLACVL
jgi:hypothetical protein